MKSYLKKRQRGFTLVELLIVVVIIVILSALVVPRLIAQPEKAIMAEAHQMLGVLRRAQITRADSTGAAFVSIDYIGGVATDPAVATKLGLQANIGVGSFNYDCSGTAPVPHCHAQRVGGSDYDGSFVTIDLDTGIISCVPGPNLPYVDAPGPTQQCIPG